MVEGGGVAKTRHKKATKKTSPRTTLGGSTRTFREPVHNDGYYDDMWRGATTTAAGAAETTAAGATAGATGGGGSSSGGGTGVGGSGDDGGGGGSGNGGGGGDGGDGGDGGRSGEGGGIAGAGAGAGVVVNIGASSSPKAAQLSSIAEPSRRPSGRRTSLQEWFRTRLGGSTKGGDGMIDHREEDNVNKAPIVDNTNPSLMEPSYEAFGTDSDTAEPEATANTAAATAAAGAGAGAGAAAAAAAAAADETCQPIDRNELIEAIIEHHTLGDDDFTPKIRICDGEQTSPNSSGPLQEGLSREHNALDIKSRLSSSAWNGIFDDDTEPPFSELNVYDEDEFAADEADYTRDDIELEAAREENKGHAHFLSATMGLTVDVSDALQPPEGEHDFTHGDDDNWPASPCEGMITESSPRYSVLQTFRKKMCTRGIDAQMFHPGWKGRLLPARNIRLFMTDTRQSSVLYWRYRRKGAGGGDGELGAEDRRIIPLSSLANIGHADLKPRAAKHNGDSLWSTLTAAAAWPRGGKEQHSGPAATRSKAVSKGAAQGPDGAGKADASAGLVDAVPVLTISYWVEGEPRWVGDEPKRLLLRPENLDGFRQLTEGLRLCCLHFHNYACPHDLEDTQ